MEPLSDQELNQVLATWVAPPAPGHLPLPMLRRPWYKAIWTTSVRIPVPVLALILLLGVLLQIAPERTRVQKAPSAARELRLSDFQPVREAQAQLSSGRLNKKPISLWLLAAALCPAYQVIQSGYGLKDGVGFRYETRVEPRIEGQKVMAFSGGGIRVGDNFHRYLRDHETRRYLGYDIRIDKQTDGSVVVALAPLSLSLQKLGSRGSGRRFRCRFVDHLVFEPASAALRLPEGSPRDFALDDVPLKLMNPKVSLNGKLLEASGGRISGEAVYIYLPEHGHFAMSLVPHPELGFRKLGEVRGARITFRDGSNEWTVHCSEPVAPGGGVFNLYVNADPAWRPPGGADVWQMGASAVDAMISRSRRGGH